jgi:general secretion pathway protein J|tara:strand:- start:6088 stop:6873 length:786 start_codon:yes stop_codon:yes gene_type:complete
MWRSGELHGRPDPGRWEIPVNSSGFTLLEVMVAVAIFALIGLGANQVLSTVIDTRDVTEARTEQFVSLQRALDVIERDLTQFANRPIRDELGDPMHALLIGSDLYNLEFTRVGWRNPLGVPRSSLQRVAYQLLEGELLRHYWLVLDRAEDSEPVTQTILTDVDDFRITALAAEGDSTYLWPPDDENPVLELPLAMELFVSMAGIGEIRKVVNLVSLPKRSSGDQDGQYDDAGRDSDADELDEDEEDEDDEDEEDEEDEDYD